MQFKDDEQTLVIPKEIFAARNGDNSITLFLFPRPDKPIMLHYDSPDNYALDIAELKALFKRYT